MSFTKPVKKVAIEVASTSDFHPDDVPVANKRFLRLKASFRKYALVRSASSDVNESVILGELPNLIYLTFNIKRVEDVFALTVGKQQHRFLIEYAHLWEWSGVDIEPYPRERLYEEVMEFINDYAE